MALPFIHTQDRCGKSHVILCTAMCANLFRIGKRYRWVLDWKYRYSYLPVKEKRYWCIPNLHIYLWTFGNISASAALDHSGPPYPLDVGNDLICTVQHFFPSLGWSGEGLESMSGLCCCPGLHWGDFPSLPVLLTKGSEQKSSTDRSKKSFSFLFRRRGSLEPLSSFYLCPCCRFVPPLPVSGTGSGVKFLWCNPRKAVKTR